MRVVVTGATGNVGTALLARLAADPSIAEIVGVSRRPPAGIELPRTRFVRADVGRDPLEGILRRADAVVHLAWQIQPSRAPRELWRTNVEGTSRVIAAALATGVATLVHASSVGVYSPGPTRRAVDESWPHDGMPSSFYARHKAEAEARLDALEAAGADIRVVRMRPGLILSRRAASGVRRLFLGRLVPRAALAPGRIPVVPDIPGLRLQALHSDDAAAAYHRALVTDAAGAFNVAAEPVLDPSTIAQALGARAVAVPAGLARGIVWASWRAGLQPTPPGWLDLALGVPVMDCSRARRELGWEPRLRSTDALVELLAGMADGAGAPTPPLAPARR